MKDKLLVWHLLQWASLHLRYTSYSCTTLTHLSSDLKAASFERLPEPEKIPQQVQSALQATLALGLYDPADIMVLEMSATDRDVFGGFGSSI